ncbi:MAG: DNA cytosine methyltransferase [Microcoleus sp.]
MKHLDLFSGIGGFALAAHWVGGIETTQFVEIEPFCQKILAKNFPGVPIHDDVTTFTTHRGEFDLVTAGFPCQDISIAGHGVGLDGKRSGLFFEIVRIIRECRPRFVVLENVAALLSCRNGRDMGAVLWELSESGYDAEWDVIPASALGANHARERTWIVAYANSDRRSKPQWEACREVLGRRFLSENFDRKKLRPGHQCHELLAAPRLGDIAEFPRVDDGVSTGLDEIARRSRIKALGNAIVPQVALIPLQRVKDLTYATEQDDRHAQQRLHSPTRTKP